MRRERLPVFVVQCGQPFRKRLVPALVGRSVRGVGGNVSVPDVAGHRQDGYGAYPSVRVGPGVIVIMTMAFFLFDAVVVIIFLCVMIVAVFFGGAVIVIIFLCVMIMAVF